MVWLLSCKLLSYWIRYHNCSLCDPYWALKKLLLIKMYTYNILPQSIEAWAKDLFLEVSNVLVIKFSFVYCTACKTLERKLLLFQCGIDTFYLFLISFLAGIWELAHLYGKNPPVPFPHAWEERCSHWVCFAYQRHKSQYWSWIYLSTGGNGE